MTSPDLAVRGQVDKTTPIKIFVDGSAHPNTPSGSGVYIDYGDTEMLSFNVGNVDIKLAELYAIKKGAQWIINNIHHLQGEKIDIYCDSQAAIYSVASKTTVSHTTKRTRHALEAAGKFCNLTIKWVKSHSTSTGNAAADFAANKGRLKPYLAIDSPRPSWAQVKLDLVLKTNMLWDTMWALLDSCRQTKQWFPKHDPARSFKIMKLKRLQWGKICQFITGHNTLNRHLYLTGVDEEVREECYLCYPILAEPMTTSNVMGSCPALMWTRAKIFNQYFMEPPFELPIGKVLLFMKECGLEPIKWDD